MTEKTEHWVKLKKNLIPRGVYNIAPIVIKKAYGPYLEDIEGRVFIDFAAGLGTVNIGHTHPRVIKAVKDKIDDYQHLCFHVTLYPDYINLAKKLSEISPGEPLKKVMFANSGAEAVENAVKITRAFTKKRVVITFDHAFHGRTLLALSLTSKVIPYKKDFGPFSGDVYRMPYAYCYRCAFGSTYPDCGIYCAKYLEEKLNTELDPDDTAALIVEPVIGEGGFIVPPKEFLKELRRISSEYNILYIDDEVQAGMGRCGRYFAIELFDVIPDIIVLAKSLSAGFPLSAVIGPKSVMDAPIAGGLGGTFGGNPVSCTSALVVLEILKEEKLLERAEKIGGILLERFKKMKDEISLIGDYRGMGAMWAIELVKDRENKIPAKEEAKSVLEICLKKGLVILKAGTFDNVIRILAPLVIEYEVLNKGLDILEESLKSIKYAVV